jgi:hypothetical protein
MEILVKFLILIAFAVLTTAVAHIAGFPLVSDKHLQLLPAVAISSGVLIASLSYLKDKRKHDLEVSLKRDEVNLQMSKEGFSEVYDLLSDLNNSRVVWIRAARVLLNTIEIGKTIDNNLYQTAFSLTKEELRVKLYRLLHVEPHEESDTDLESLPPQFFYGVENWRNRDLLIDDAAILSKSKIRAYSVTLNKVTPEPKNSQLDNRSVVAIYEFVAEQDKDFIDPLSKIEEWTGDSHDKFGIQQGPARYIEHKSRNHVVDGKIYKNERS